MKFRLAIKLDVTKIDRARLFRGNKGTYLSITGEIDTECPGQFGDHGFFTQESSKEERANGLNMPILGNGKIIWRDDANCAPAPAPAPEFDSAEPDPFKF